MLKSSQIFNRSINDLLSYAEVTIKHHRLICALNELIKRVEKERSFNGEQLTFKIENDILTIRATKEDEMSFIATIPWIVGIEKSGEEISKNIYVNGWGDYLSYGELLYDYHLELIYVPKPDGHDFLVMKTEELSEIIINELKLDTQYFPYYNEAACYEELKEWKGARSRPGDYPDFLRMLEKNYGPNGRLLKDLKLN